MKNWTYTLLALSLVIGLPTNSHAQAEMVTIPKSTLTKEQVVATEQAALQSRINTYGKWVGLGKEVGEAVNGSLTAVTEQTAKFADTKIGKIMTVVVVWKVIGRDVTGIVFAACLWGVVGTLLTVLMFRHGFDRMVVTEAYTEGTKTTKKFAVRRGQGKIVVVCIVGYAVLLVASAIAIFGGG